MATYDYIIVGGGSAGCVVAARLSEDPAAKVLLLEAGSADKSRWIHWPAGLFKLLDGSDRFLFSYQTSPIKNVGNRELYFPQGKVLGGGSSVNAMVYLRGNALDYDGWASEGCEGWAYRDVLPYFCKSEANERFSNEYHGVDGPLGVSDHVSPLPINSAFIKACQEAGIPYNSDFNGAYQEGCGHWQVTQRSGRRSSTAAAFLRPAMDRPNLEVKVESQASRIILEKGRATGVEYSQSDVSHQLIVHADQEVILASGAIGSPKLLMLSGIGRAEDLSSVGINTIHELSGVGRNLQDHIDIFSIYNLFGPDSLDRYKSKTMQFWAGLQWYLFRSGPVTTNFVESGAFWYADYSESAPDIQFHLLAISGLEPQAKATGNHGVTLNCIHLRPRSRGWVKLVSSDPSVAPEINPNYWSDSYDMEMGLRCAEKGRQIMIQPSLKPYVRSEFAPGSEVKTRNELLAYAKKIAKTDYHPVGTCKMGVDNMAVVDPRLRVRGIEGLRIVDSSIMPRITSCNTNAPSIMIGEKGADLIKGISVSA